MTTLRFPVLAAILILVALPVIAEAVAKEYTCPLHPEVGPLLMSGHQMTDHEMPPNEK